MVYFCKKHNFVPQGSQLEHCFAQNSHRNCKNLTTLPTEHPKLENYNGRHRRRKEARELLKRLRRAG
jgi:hypothetical protein